MQIRHLSPHVESEPEDRVCDPLTTREREALLLLAHGLSHDAAAAYLIISINTFKQHCIHIREKLQAHTLTEAVYIAVQTGQLDVLQDRYTYTAICHGAERHYPAPRT